MRKVFLLQEDEKMRRTLEETREMMLAAVTHEIPTATTIADHPEISKLHDILALMRNGDISLNSYDIGGNRCLTLEVNDDREFRITFARI